MVLVAVEAVRDPGEKAVTVRLVLAAAQTVLEVVVGPMTVVAAEQGAMVETPPLQVSLVLRLAEVRVVRVARVRVLTLLQGASASHIPLRLRLQNPQTASGL
jgi:hypothetical protein